MDELKIVKIGGGILSDETALEKCLDAFAEIKGPKILVHGGGRQATQLCEKLGIETTMIDGRRITTAEVLEVTVMSYAGLTGKKLASKLQQKGCYAMSLSGVDGNLIRAEKRKPEPVDFGFVGDIREINVNLLSRLLGEGLVPVINSIVHDTKGDLLNTNADTVAAELAVALSAMYSVGLVYCFEFGGVLLNRRDPRSVISDLDHSLYQLLISSSKIDQGMKPKLDNAFKAIERGVKEVRIGSCRAISDSKKGTQMVWS